MGCSGSSFGRVERVGSDTSLERQLTREGAGARWIRTPDQGFERQGGSEQQPEKRKGLCIPKACMLKGMHDGISEQMISRDHVHGGVGEAGLGYESPPKALLGLHAVVWRWQLTQHQQAVHMVGGVWFARSTSSYWPRRAAKC